MSFAAIGIVAASVAVVGAGVGAYGTIASANAASESAKYNSAVASNNAGAAAQQAKFNAQQIQDKTRRQVATQRAAMAASGFDANSGSFIDVTNSTKRAGELDKLSTLYQGSLAVNQQMSQAQLDQSQAGFDQFSGAVGATGTILSGIGSASEIISNPSFSGGGQE